MLASELRIGNLAYSGGDYYCIERGEDLDWLSFKPIPLTEEILLKCGFLCSRMHIKNYIHLTTINFELRNTSVLDGGFRIVAGFSEPKYFKKISDEIEYLHQLQNLYFALTGKELDINL